MFCSWKAGLEIAISLTVMMERYRVYCREGSDTKISTPACNYNDVRDNYCALT
jgi:hypothetical protein